MNRKRFVDVYLLRLFVSSLGHGHLLLGLQCSSYVLVRLRSSYPTWQPSGDFGLSYDSL